MATPISIRTDHRITVIGGTGDGKTTLALHLTAYLAKHGRQKVVILNPAAEDKYYDLFGDGRPDIDERWPDVQHVTPLMTNDYKQYGPLWMKILRRGNVLTVIDETAAMASTNNYAPELMYLLQMGRRRNCGIIAITQRPVRIPTFLLDMSDHIFVGDVRGRNLSYIENFTDQEWRSIVQQRRPYEFAYWSKWTKEPPRLVKVSQPVRK